MEQNNKNQEEKNQEASAPENKEEQDLQSNQQPEPPKPEEESLETEEETENMPEKETEEEGELKIEDNKEASAQSEADDVLSKEDDSEPINVLPEYEIRTMKNDQAEAGIKKLEKEADREELKKKIEKRERELREKKEEESTRPIKTALPSTEELIGASKKQKSEKVPEPPKPEKAPEPPTPEKTPEPTKPEAPEPPKPELKKETEEKPEPPKNLPTPRKSKKGILTVLIIAILIIGIGFGIYFGFFSKKEPETTPPVTEQPNPPATLIHANKTTIIEIKSKDLIKEKLEEKENQAFNPGTIERIAFLKGSTFLTTTDIIEGLNINIPPYVKSEFTEDHTLFLYTQNGKRHLGIAIRIEGPESLKEQMNFWEKTMIEDLNPIFLSKTTKNPATQEFQDNTYKNASIRYINFPDPDITIDYAITSNNLIITTSKEAIYTAIDRIVDNL
ncbi:MAG: hypothetical protein GF387_02800 [Candidatus Portnoybacteria bacterium]|nr:hypothetical protein [Candidatus Portnoybacteria bacterium]